MQLRLIPAGEFMMGSEETKAQHEKEFGVGYDTSDERPVHRVRITRPFYLGVHEVTRGQFADFVAATGHKTDAERKESMGGSGWSEEEMHITQKLEFTWRSWGAPQTDAHPVVIVSWNDAVAFCAWLSKEEGRKYRLPTEAEWEYACRAGTTTSNYNGDDLQRLVEIANVADSAFRAKLRPDWQTVEGRDGFAFTSPVGQFRPNAFGLYDMIGNAWEWCGDRYDASYYAVSPPDDPTGPSAGSFRAIRGGDWCCDRVFCRSARRLKSLPVINSHYTGFRIACER